MSDGRAGRLGGKLPASKSDGMGVTSEGGNVVTSSVESEVTGGGAKVSLSPYSEAGADCSSARSPEKTSDGLGVALEV